MRYFNSADSADSFAWFQFDEAGLVFQVQQLLKLHLEIWCQEKQDKCGGEKIYKCKDSSVC